MARYAGGSLAQAIYVSILSNTQGKRAAITVPAAAIKAGLPASSASQILAAFSLGTAALEAVPGLTPEILAAASDAYKWSYAHGLQYVGLCLSAPDIHADIETESRHLLLLALEYI